MPRAFTRFDSSQILLSNKKRPQNGLFCLMARLIGDAYCSAICPACRPKVCRLSVPVFAPLGCKTILRIVLLYASCLLKVRFLSNSIIKQKKTAKRSFCLMARLIGIEPTATRRRRPVLYPLSYKRIILKVRCGKHRTFVFIYLKKFFSFRPLCRSSFCLPGKRRKHTADRKV